MYHINPLAQKLINEHRQKGINYIYNVQTFACDSETNYQASKHFETLFPFQMCFTFF